MAHIPIWPGSSSFAATTNPTPFAFYDTDTAFQIINSFSTLEGTTTGSNFNNQLITPNLGGTVNLSEQYGNESDGSGGDYEVLKGVLNASMGVQKYDLLSSVSSSLSGSEKVYIKKIMHYQPAAINRYFDPYAGTGTGIQSLM